MMCAPRLKLSAPVRKSLTSMTEAVVCTQNDTFMVTFTAAAASVQEILRLVNLLKSLDLIYDKTVQEIAKWNV